MEFAVLDAETTGLSPSHSYRVVEFGHSRVDDWGTVLPEFETLINPGR
jgi:DNA polymerase III alpha subunit (gram-positive type)